MATVRFSKELQDAILNNARGVFGNKVAAARDAKPDNAWGERIYSTLFGEHIVHLNAVPTHFFKMVDKIKVDRVGGITINCEFTLNSTKPFPYSFPNSEYAKKASNYGDEIELKDNLAWGELYADVVRWRDGVKDIEAKRDEFVKQVKTIIEAHATLAPALKMWTPLWDLVPEEYKNRHREVKEREKKEVSLDGVDLSSLTSIVVANKLTR